MREQLQPIHNQQCLVLTRDSGSEEYFNQRNYLKTDIVICNIRVIILNKISVW